MKNGLPYYKAYPRDFIEGTIGMPFEIKCAYRVVLDLIYMQGGRLPDDPRYIAGSLGCSIRKWRSIRAELVRMGKLDVSGEFLTNKRAEKEVETLAKLQEKQRENASGPRKNNDLQEPWQRHTEPEPDIYTLPNGNDAGGVTTDIRDVVWQRGVPYLVRCGVKEPQARSFIGKCLKAASPADVFNALSSAANAKTADPIPYITEILKPEETTAERNERLWREL